MNNRDLANELVKIARLLTSGKWPKPTTKKPDEEKLMEMYSDGGCEATDGCRVEPDGICEHGHPSWLMQLGWM